MSLLGNIVWLIFGGFVAAIGYFIGGVLMCLTIIGIPFGIKAIQIAGMMLTPFGKSVQPTKGGEGCLAMAFNILWLVLFGWEIAIAHIVSGIVLGITIIGLPLAKQHFKLVPVALFPYSYKLQS